MGSASPLIDGTTGARPPVKPPHGSPCNGCGYCCEAEPCAIVREYIPGHPAEGPCRALEWIDGHYACGTIRQPRLLHAPSERLG